MHEVQLPCFLPVIAKAFILMRLWKDRDTKEEDVVHCDKEWDEQNVLKILCNVFFVLNREQKEILLA